MWQSVKAIPNHHLSHMWDKWGPDFCIGDGSPMRPLWAPGPYKGPEGACRGLVLIHKMPLERARKNPQNAPRPPCCRFQACPALVPRLGPGSRVSNIFIFCDFPLPTDAWTSFKHYLSQAPKSSHSDFGCFRNNRVGEKRGGLGRVRVVFLFALFL